MNNPFKKICLIVLTGMLLMHQPVFSQQQLSYNDTSYFMPYDLDFNLIMSASRGHYDNVRSLIIRKGNVNSLTDEGVSAIMYAADNGDLEMVRILSSAGANINLQPYNGKTALISAVINNHSEVAEYLLSQGANPNLKDLYGVTALNHAASLNLYIMTDMLLFYKADPAIGDMKGHTPLHASVYANGIETVRLLLLKGVDPDVKDKDGFTPLMIAAQKGHKEIAELLLQNGADANAENNGSMTALAFAVKSGNLTMAELLINAGGEVNHNIGGSRNILMLAEENKEDEMVELLKENGAKSNLSPDFSRLITGPELRFNARDFMLAYNIGFHDVKYNIGINSGFVFRPSAVRILNELSDTLSYQYWERRSAFYLGIEKKFSLTKRGAGKSFGPLLEFTGLYTFGGYRGSNTNPDAGFVWSPSAGIFWANKWLNLEFRYDYINFNVTGLNPGMFSFSTQFIFPLKKKRLSGKEINWINQ